MNDFSYQNSDLEDFAAFWGKLDPYDKEQEVHHHHHEMIQIFERALDNQEIPLAHRQVGEEIFRTLPSSELEKGEFQYASRILQKAGIIPFRSATLSERLIQAIESNDMVFAANLLQCPVALNLKDCRLIQQCIKGKQGASAFAVEQLLKRRIAEESSRLVGETEAIDLKSLQQLFGKAMRETSTGDLETITQIRELIVDLAKAAIAREDSKALAEIVKHTANFVIQAHQTGAIFFVTSVLNLESDQRAYIDWALDEGEVDCIKWMILANLEIEEWAEDLRVDLHDLPSLFQGALKELKIDPVKSHRQWSDIEQELNGAIEKGDLIESRRLMTEAESLLRACYFMDDSKAFRLILGQLQKMVYRHFVENNAAAMPFWDLEDQDPIVLTKLLAAQNQNFFLWKLLDKISLEKILSSRYGYQDRIEAFKREVVGEKLLPPVKEVAALIVKAFGEEDLGEIAYCELLIQANIRVALLNQEEQIIVEVLEFLAQLVLEAYDEGNLPFLASLLEYSDGEVELLEGILHDRDERELYLFLLEDLELEKKMEGTHLTFQQVAALKTRVLQALDVALPDASELKQWVQTTIRKLPYPPLNRKDLMRLSQALRRELSSSYQQEQLIKLEERLDLQAALCSALIENGYAQQALEVVSLPYEIAPLMFSSFNTLVEGKAFLFDLQQLQFLPARKSLNYRERFCEKFPHLDINHITPLKSPYQEKPDLKVLKTDLLKAVKEKDRQQLAACNVELQRIFSDAYGRKDVDAYAACIQIQLEVIKEALEQKRPDMGVMLLSSFQLTPELTEHLGEGMKGSLIWHLVFGAVLRDEASAGEGDVQKNQTFQNAVVEKLGFRGQLRPSLTFLEERIEEALSLGNIVGMGLLLQETEINLKESYLQGNAIDFARCISLYHAVLKRGIEAGNLTLLASCFSLSAEEIFQFQSLFAAGRESTVFFMIIERTKIENWAGSSEDTPERMRDFLKQVTQKLSLICPDPQALEIIKNPLDPTYSKIAVIEMDVLFHTSVLLRYAPKQFKRSSNLQY